MEQSVVDIDDLPKREDSIGQGLGIGLGHACVRRHGIKQHGSWRRSVDRFTVRAVCSEEDRVMLRGDSDIQLIPNGFARQRGTTATPPIRRVSGLSD